MAENSEKKRPVGRPTKYDPALCEKVIELGKLGKSRAQIASELDIGWRNLQNWEGAHEEFRAALEESRIHAMAHWETLAQTYAIEMPQAPKLNAGLYKISMAARFPEFYRDNAKLELTGKNDGPLQIDVMHDFSQNLINDLLAVRQRDAEAGDS